MSATVISRAPNGARKAAGLVSVYLAPPDRERLERIAKRSRWSKSRVAGELIAAALRDSARLALLVPAVDAAALAHQVGDVAGVTAP